MIPPDREIHDVEQRIARRREEVEFFARESGRRAWRALASPGALVAAGIVGFLAGGGVGRKKKKYVERRKADQSKKARATGIAGALMTGAMWLVKQQFGSPMALAQFILSKAGHRRASSYGDGPR